MTDARIIGAGHNAKAEPLSIHLDGKKDDSGNVVLQGWRQELMAGRLDRKGHADQMVGRVERALDALGMGRTWPTPASTPSVARSTACRTSHPTSGSKPVLTPGIISAACQLLAKKSWSLVDAVGQLVGAGAEENPDSDSETGFSDERDGARTRNHRIDSPVL